MSILGKLFKSDKGYIEELEHEIEQLKAENEELKKKLNKPYELPYDPESTKTYTCVIDPQYPSEVDILLNIAIQQKARIAEATKLIKYVLYSDEIDECFEAQQLIELVATGG